MLELEPPRHTRLRRLVLRAFTSRRIDALAPMIEALCHRLIDAFPSDPFDLLPAYAQPLPVIVIARLLGVPEAEAGRLLAWSNAMVAMYQARRDRAAEDAAATAAAEFAIFLRGHLALRRDRPADDPANPRADPQAPRLSLGRHSPRLRSHAACGAHPASRAPSTGRQNGKSSRALSPP